MTSPKEALEKIVKFYPEHPAWCRTRIDASGECDCFLDSVHAAIPVADLHEEAVDLLPWFEVMYKSEGESTLAHFERIGQVFHNDCRCLRPGKDDPLCRPEEQIKRWDLWIADHLNKVSVLLTQLEALKCNPQT